MSGDWRDYALSPDSTHHVHRGKPAYSPRFFEALKFHAPGLAPVLDASGAYHIAPDGQPAYSARYLRTFGFYEGRAAVRSKRGWFHILPDGTPLYGGRFAWCGNFQEGRCAVRSADGGYFHIAADGAPAYEERYRYVGDYKDGCAVAQAEDGAHTHIDAFGNRVHGRWFLDLDVFHKNYARARDSRGWHHVDRSGKPLYARRFGSVEPFYNGQARVEGLDGSLSVIDESGETILVLRDPAVSHVERLSGEMVGLWKTQTIRAAAELGAIDTLPATADAVERSLRLSEGAGVRLMRALTELELVHKSSSGVYHPTDLGAHLARSHPLTLADAALHWGRESYAAWSGVTEALRSGQSGFEKIYGASFFDWIQDKPADLQAYHAAMSTYAKHDYHDLAEFVDFTTHEHALDAGGGAGELTFALLRSCPELTATVMDRPEVVEIARLPKDLEHRCRFIAGDIFRKWHKTSDAVILARVLHDWRDSDALRILKRARESMRRDATLYVIEMIPNDETGDGGLLDLNMLAMTEGAERTEEQFRNLLAQAGFRMLDATPTRSPSSIIRARAI